MCYIGVTNIGRIDIASEHGALCIKNMGFSVHWGIMILTVVSFLDQVNLNLIIMKPVYTKEHVAKIADLIIELSIEDC